MGGELFGALTTEGWSSVDRERMLCACHRSGARTKGSASALLSPTAARAEFDDLDGRCKNPLYRGYDVRLGAGNHVLVFNCWPENCSFTALHYRSEFMSPLP
jgi:hypothetical protein